LEAWLAILVAYYSVGAHVDTRRGVRVIAVAMLPLLTADVTNAIGGDHSAIAVSSGGGVYALLVLTWATGNAFRRRGFRELELEDRAERLERERAQNMQAAVEQERARIARELHDVVAHSVSVMVVQMGAAREIMSSEPHTARATLRSADATGRQALDSGSATIGARRGYAPTGVGGRCPCSGIYPRPRSRFHERLRRRRFRR